MKGKIRTCVLENVFARPPVQQQRARTRVVRLLGVSFHPFIVISLFPPNKFLAGAMFCTIATVLSVKAEDKCKVS